MQRRRVRRWPVRQVKIEFGRKQRKLVESILHFLYELLCTITKVYHICQYTCQTARPFIIIISMVLRTLKICSCAIGKNPSLDAFEVGIY